MILTFNDDRSISRGKEIHMSSTVLDFTKRSFNANQIVYLVGQILEERESLSVAISKAKHNAEVDIDVATSSNKKRQEFIQRLTAMAKIKPYETMEKGSYYKFNSIGNQITNVYDIKKYTSIDFDRNQVKQLIKDLSDECDKVSTDIERILITAEVEFEPRWLLVDTLEDICEDID